jgi:hypothetical protein
LASLMTTSALARISPDSRLESVKLRPIAEFAPADELRFNELVDEIVDQFQDTVRAYGGTLVKDVNWNSAIVNATAHVIGSKWTIVAFGGLYRVDGLSQDGFQLAICHEAGHLLGGYPNYGGSTTSTSEGQSDYFAAHVCAKKVWASQALSNQAAFDAAPESVRDACRDAWSDSTDAHLCARVAVAAERLIAALSRDMALSLTTPDTRVAVATIYSGYPQPQCRIDTYYRGALCGADWDFALIPGRAHPLNGIDAETEAHLYSCHESRQPAAARPACWYVQRVD